MNKLSLCYLNLSAFVHMLVCTIIMLLLDLDLSQSTDTQTT